MEGKKLDEKFIETKKGRIYYYSNHFFAGRPFAVLLHGLSANHTTWLDIIKAFDKNRINCLAVDLRGHGRSDKTKEKNLYDISVFSEDLAAIVEKEKIDKFILAGYSFGGAVAMDYAIKYQDKISLLILISTNYINFFEHIGLKFLTPLASIFLNMLANFFIWQKRSQYEYYRPDRSKGYLNSVWQGFKTMPLSVNFWMLAEMVRTEYKRTISSISAPTLLVYSKGDPFIADSEISAMAGLLRQAEVAVSKFPKHFIASLSPKELPKLILKFIKKYEDSHIQ